MRKIDILVIIIFAITFLFLAYYYFSPQEDGRTPNYNFTESIKENISTETAEVNYSEQGKDNQIDSEADNSLAEETNTTINETVIVVKNETFSERTFKVANWNLQIFGDTKASKPELMNFYADKLDNYDIDFIQEIKDADGSAFVKLCSMMGGYECKISSRAGRSTSKEQYGIIYKKGISIVEFKDYNPDSQDRWERPPIEVTFNVDGYELTIYNIHTKPDDAPQEIASLEGIAKSSGNVIVLGDLNADCSYYNPSVEHDFSSWNWIIKDSDDTTVSDTNCAYDRIIMDSDAYNEYQDSGIDMSGINKDLSDHYVVWVELKV